MNKLNKINQDQMNKYELNQLRKKSEEIHKIVLSLSPSKDAFPVGEKEKESETNPIELMKASQIIQKNIKELKDKKFKEVDSSDHLWLLNFERVTELLSAIQRGLAVVEEECDLMDCKTYNFWDSLTKRTKEENRKLFMKLIEAEKEKRRLENNTNMLSTKATSDQDTISSTSSHQFPKFKMRKVNFNVT